MDDVGCFSPVAGATGYTPAALRALAAKFGDSRET